MKNFLLNKINKILIIKWLILILSTNYLYAKSLDNNEILNNIEKSLLFDNDDKQNINFYKQNTDSQSDFSIIKGSNNKTSNNKKDASKIDVVVVNVSQDSDSIAEKLNLAYNASLADQNEVAIQYYKEILHLSANNQYAKFSLAVLYQKMNQFSQAKKLYHELLSDNPENKHQIISNLLSILIDESPHEAIYFLSRLSKQNPNSSYILAKLALAYENIGEYDMAVNYLEEASNKDNDNLEYIYNLAIIFDKLNEKEKAIRNYQIVLKNHSGNNKLISVNSIKSRINFLKSLK